MLIFLSALALASVFIRRAYLISRKKEVTEKEELFDGSFDELKNQKVAKGDAVQASALYSKGELLMEAGKEDEAIKMFVQALALDALHVETQNKLAMLYMKKQMFSSASALFAQLAQLTDDSVHYSHLGLSLYQQNEFEKSRDAYQKAVELDPSRPQRYASLAQVYRSLGQLQNSVIALNKAADLDQENIDYLLLLAELFIELGDTEAAKNMILRVMEIDEANENAKMLMEELKALRADLLKK